VIAQILKVHDAVGKSDIHSVQLNSRRSTASAVPQQSLNSSNRCLRASSAFDINITLTLKYWVHCLFLVQWCNQTDNHSAQPTRTHFPALPRWPLTFSTQTHTHPHGVPQDQDYRV